MICINITSFQGHYRYVQACIELEYYDRAMAMSQQFELSAEKGSKIYGNLGSVSLNDIVQLFANI